MKRLEYILFRILQYKTMAIPMVMLYIFSDFTAFVLQYIIRYRRETVHSNLRRSFPEKSEKEQQRITRNFYKNLSDVFLESLKGISLSIEELTQRYKCINPELANSYFEKGQSVIFAMSHYANWEWGTQVAESVFLHNTISIYKPLSNRFIDRYTCDQREARGMALYPIHKTRFIFRSEDRIPRAYFLISDQSPSNLSKAYWINFLNQETACLRGIERYAQTFNLPVIYLDIQRVKRGYYTVELKEICNNPQSTTKGEITNRYMKNLEEIIIKKPEDWLWSHRRWKRKKLDNTFSDYMKSSFESVIE